MCPWCCILLSVVFLKSTQVKDHFWLNCDVLTSTLSVCFVSIETKTIYLGYVQ